MEQSSPSHRSPGCILIVFRYFILIELFWFLCSTLSPVLGAGLVNSSRSQPPKSTVANLNEIKLHWEFPSAIQRECKQRVLHGLLNLVKCNSSKPKRGIPWIPCAIQLILQLSSLRQGENNNPPPIVCLARIRSQIACRTIGSEQLRHCFDNLVFNDSRLFFSPSLHHCIICTPYAVVQHI